MNYTAKVECSNCYWKGSLAIPFGLAVEEMPCPKCYTKKLVEAEEEAEQKPKEE